MKLTYENYTLVVDSDRFDLHKEVDGETKEGLPKKIDKTIGYSFSLKAAIIRIAYDKMDGREDMTLKQYISELRIFEAEIERILQN